MDLRQYEQVKFDLASILRAATHTPSPEQVDVRSTGQDLFARLAEDRFNLVVVGRFNRGKTSLMNAVCGADWLPTGVVPLTSVITAVTYGSEPQAVLHFRGTRLVEDVPLDRLAENITERGNPGNRRNIRMAEVQVPVEILRRGFSFVDTPGLGSSIAENTRTTESFLPEADAFVLVTSYDSPLTEEERRVLDLVRATRRRAFVVVNKSDTVSPHDRLQIEAHVEAQLADVFGSEAPPFYPVSARRALDARLQGDAALLEASGLPRLEGDLTAYLLEERRGEFLRVMCDRVATVIARGGASPDVAVRLDRLRAELGVVAAASAGDRGAGLATGIAECEICRAVADAVFDFLAQQQAKLGRDAAAEAEFARRGGLCLQHAWHFERLAAPRETCTGFAPVLDAQAYRLDAIAAALPDSAASAPTAFICDRIDGLIPDARRCEACVAALRRAEAASEAIATDLRADPARMRDVSAICLTHLGALAAKLPAADASRLLRRQGELLRRLADDMRRFALKQDAAKRFLASCEDLAAARRGMRVLTGRPDAAVAPPSRRE